MQSSVSSLVVPLQPIAALYRAPKSMADATGVKNCGASQVPLSMMADAKRPADACETMCQQTLNPPALSPKIVTREGSPAGPRVQNQKRAATDEVAVCKRPQCSLASCIKPDPLTTKCGDVVMHPLQGQRLVLQALVASAAVRVRSAQRGESQEAERPQAVVVRNDNRACRQAHARAPRTMGNGPQ